jgi:hypothetical protein
MSNVEGYFPRISACVGRYSGTEMLPPLWWSRCSRRRDRQSARGQQRSRYGNCLRWVGALKLPQPPVIHRTEVVHQRILAAHAAADENFLRWHDPFSGGCRVGWRIPLVRVGGAPSRASLTLVEGDLRSRPVTESPDALLAGPADRGQVAGWVMIGAMQQPALPSFRALASGRRWARPVETGPARSRRSVAGRGKTDWMIELNRIRNQNAHDYVVSEEEHEFLTSLTTWLVQGQAENDL